MNIQDNLEGKKIAIVCDWIKDWGWAEAVLSEFMEIFPNADIYTSIFYQKDNPIFKWRNVYTSFIQKKIFFNKSHKLALFLRPKAFESFDLNNYDIVLTSSSAESKWVITKAETLQITYCHTPVRYFWSHYHEYLKMMEFGWFLNYIWKIIAPKIIHKLRTWDYIAAQRSDYFIANSINTRSRVKKYYSRDSDVIYPPVKISEFNFCEEKEDFYLYVWRCIPYKKFDLIVDTFNENWKKIVLVTNTKNKLSEELKEKSKDNIIWKVNISRGETKKLFEKAKWFIFPPEEDFGIVPLEAMACWTPVIAYKKWWALETVIDWKTWIFFEEQSVNSLNNALELFENTDFDLTFLREHAEKFDSTIFRKNILEYISDKYKIM